MSLAGDLRQDLRYGLRGLRRSPGLSAMVALSLALGIAANAAIFSVLNAVMWRRLPVSEPERLVFLTDAGGSGRSTRMIVKDGRLVAYSYPLYQQLRGEPSFSGLAAEDSMSDSALVARAGVADTPVEGRGVAVSSNYFDVMGVSASRGRTFLPEDETTAGANPVAVFSHGYWQRRFGSDPSIVGARVAINNQPYTVVGVASPRFTGSKVGQAVDFWVPLTMHGQLHQEPSMLDKRDNWWLHLIGRVAPGASRDAGVASLNLILGRHLAEIRPIVSPTEKDQIDRRAVRIESTAADRGASELRSEFRTALLALEAGVALLLLIVCLNVSHLLLARAVGRQREMSIRTALGASRGRLARQLLTEGLLFAGLGLIGAALLTGWLIDGLLALAVPASVGRALAVTIDGRVVAFTAVLALATALLLGLVPAWQASHADLQRGLRGTARSVTTSGSRRLVSRLLMVSQVAVSLVLLVGAGLLSGTLRSVRAVDKGFQTEHLLLAEIDFRFLGLADTQLAPVHDEILRQVNALPGVVSSSMALFEILAGSRWTSTISFQGADVPIRPSPHMFVATPDYFRTVGMTLLRGRGFHAADRAGAPAVAIVNETLARKVAGGDALGKRFHHGDPSAPEPLAIEVVGIVRDAKIDDLRQAPRPTAYRPLAQALDVGVNALQVRAAGDPALLTDQVRRVVQAVNPALRISGLKTMSTAVDQSLREERLLATLSSAFGLAALFLVCLGLYGVIAQWTAQRTQEIGVRMALGATRGGVQWLVLRQAFALVLAGVVLGLPAAAAGARVIRGLLFGVAPFHPLTLGLAGLTLFLVAAAAAYLPARRASRADPMLALRSE
jgi:predicted permease